MKASYTIEEGRVMTTFTSEHLSLKKCIQIKRISEQCKMWNGFNLKSITFDSNGLVNIHIFKPFHPDNV